MKKQIKFLKGLSILSVIFMLSCSTQEIINTPDNQENVSVIKINTARGINTKEVMMQAFYWDVPMGGTWWNTIQGKVSSWAGVGITSLWMPPVSKGESGPYSVGYDPFDYFDFGDFDQKGTLETRYGSKSELQSCINAAHNAGLKVYADIVMNHNGGGVAQNNPNTGGSTNTNFQPASGIFPRGYNDFHPSTYENSDAKVFASYPDLCHKNPWVSGGLWSNSNSVAKYYKEVLGFDGWRFDWVDGFNPIYVQEFVNAAPGFAVTEYWGPSNGTSVNELQACITSSGQSSFDFPCVIGMKNAFNNNNLALLSTTEMLCKTNPSKAITFVTNHDINDIQDNKKLQAYAFIMAHEGTPCLFYTDYENLLDKSKMNTLIWINKNLADGKTTVLYADNDEYIAQMDGNPGLLIYINNSGSLQTRTVTCKWSNTSLHDFANNTAANSNSNSSGLVTITAPANNYSIWSGNGATTPISDTKTITLRMMKDVSSGNSLYFTGDNAAITNWGSGVEGIWNNGNYWTTTITIPGSTTTVNWKVRKGATGGSGNNWESGDNHAINNPVNGTTYTATFNGGF